MGTPCDSRVHLQSPSAPGEALSHAGRGCSCENLSWHVDSLSPGGPVPCSFSAPCLPLPDRVPKSPSQESLCVPLAVRLPSSAPRLPRKCDSSSQGSEHLPGRSQNWTPETEFPDDWPQCSLPNQVSPSASDGRCLPDFS